MVCIMRRFSPSVSQAGFSMVELMTVVAIVGVIAAVGIPMYSKLQAKARQSEAKLSLSALFTAEESFQKEWNQYSVTLNNIGFGVQGTRLRYKTGFVFGAGCAGYTSALGAPSEVTTINDTWSDGSGVNTGGAIWTVSISEPAAGTAGTTCSTTAYSAASYGNPGKSPTDPGSTLGDTWRINNVKLLQNTQIYLGN